ncbi:MULTISPECIES: CobW family GTP-binding protein [Streptomyces]|uniref:CobW family GTP-binding protein n=1 Tax=Streptomyces TaxID=1883 RepID=UPI00039AA33E|nr:MULTISPECIES: GTP-binding protein [Streptomyces]MBZ6085434.1 GTP-binding protein [Streptomyces olivaceus]MBZ6111797.1 GTP-binding protein [Streptomyces olivaceus]MBZ6122895.1 GTP-binding protein [Streptomyces olivaceus]MBZ6146133.1 GTP-binding protein [Streptomyces olivaceus]MBZ6158173.1 GTP-binding protein [Streptomyces olivaceus]
MSGAGRPRRPGADRPGLPVVIVGGLHAEARRAAVARLLADVPGSVVLHHDLATAAAGTVVRTVRDATGILSAGEAPLVNDCACCALREDLVPELVRLADAGGTPLAVVELWDSVEPKAMAEVVTAGGFTVTGVITAVDPALVLPYLGNGDDLAEGGLAAAATDQRTVADTFARQLEYAPVLALAEGLPGSPEADDEDRELLAQLHPTARRVPIGHGHPAGAPPADPASASAAPSSALARAALAGFDVEAAAAAQHPACALLPADADAHGVATLVWHRRRPFHPERLYAALEDLTCAAARSRGRFWLAGKGDTLLHWDAAGGALCVEGAGPWLASLPDAAWELVPPVRRAAAALDWHPEHGDRCQHLVFTSPGLDRDGLERLLESCLLTDAEYAAGQAAWELLPPAFDTLLEV